MRGLGESNVAVGAADAVSDNVESTLVGID